MTETSAERKRLAREAARRRSAVTLLQIAECGCRYAAGQLGNGASPAEARGLALEMSMELGRVARELRRLTRVGLPGQRRDTARQLARLGWGTEQIAAHLGVCDRTVRYYVAGRSPAGISRAESPAS